MIDRPSIVPAPARFAVFNWKMDEKVDSAFLVFDLVAVDAGLEVRSDPETLSIQNEITVKRRSGLSSEKRTNRVPAANASPNSTGRIRVILGPDLFGYQYVIGRIDCLRARLAKLPLDR
jgi:hypothetical protein